AAWTLPGRPLPQPPGNGWGFAPPAHVGPGAPVGGLSRNGAHHRKTPDGLSQAGAPAPWGSEGGRLERDARRRPGARRRHRDRAPAARDRQGVRLSQHGGRDRYPEHYRGAKPVRRLPDGACERAGPSGRGEAAEPGWRGLGQGATRIAAPAGCRRHGIPRLPLTPLIADCGFRIIRLWILDFSWTYIDRSLNRMPPNPQSEIRNPKSQIAFVYYLLYHMNLRSIRGIDRS